MLKCKHGIAPGNFCASCGCYIPASLIAGAPKNSEIPDYKNDRCIAKLEAENQRLSDLLDEGVDLLDDVVANPMTYEEWFEVSNLLKEWQHQACRALNEVRK